MISKLTALFALISFVGLTAAGLILKYLLAVDFSLETYFAYLLLLVFLILLLGRPFTKLALDLVRAGYQDNEEHFHVPGANLPTPQAPPLKKAGPKAGQGEQRG